MAYVPGAGDPAGDESFFASGLFGIDAAVGEVPIRLGYQLAPGYPGSPLAGPPKPRAGELGSPLLGPPSPTPPRVPVTARLIEAAQGFYRLPEDQVAELQAKLLAGGFYDDSYYTATGKKPQFGVADDDSYAAYKRALTRTARSGKALTEVLDEAVTAGGAEKAEQQRQPLIVQLTSPTDLRRIYQAAAVALTGSRDMDEDRVAKFIADQQEAERQAQQTMYSAGGSGLPGGPGGTVTEPPSPQAAAEATIRATQPTTVGGHDIAGQFDSFLSILAGIGGGGGG